MPQQMFQQPKFFRGERHVASIRFDLVARDVHHERPIDIARRLLLAFHPPEHGLHTGHERFGTEGLGDVVVRPQLQADDRVRLLRFGGQHNDGHHGGLRVCPNPLADLEAVHLGQHQVQDDQIGMLRLHVPEAVQAGHGDAGPVASLLQIQLDQFEDVFLILDDQDFLA